MSATTSATHFSTNEKDTLEEEPTVIKSSFHQLIDSECSFSSFSTLRPVCPITKTMSSTSANAWFHHASSHSAPPCYSLPDPSSPFTQGLYDQLGDWDDILAPMESHQAED